jgi:glycosyltransferase involved in cell wall biosynthesis
MKTNSIFQTIQSIKQNFCYDVTKVEIIIVDNREKIPTNDELEIFYDQVGKGVKIIRDEAIGLTSARHKGTFAAKFDLIAFVDDDVILNPHWIENVQKVFQDSNVQLATGPSYKFENDVLTRTLELFKVTIKDKGWYLDILSLQDLQVSGVFVDPTFAWGLNFIIRKRTLLQHLGFHPDLVPKKYQMFTGDGELGLTLKLKKNGIEAFYHNGLQVFHRCPPERNTINYLQSRMTHNSYANCFTTIRSDVRYKTFIVFYLKIIVLLSVHLGFYLTCILTKKLSKNIKIHEFLFKKFIYFSYYKAAFKYLNYFLTHKEIRKWIMMDDYLNSDIPKKPEVQN